MKLKVCCPFVYKTTIIFYKVIYYCMLNIFCCCQINVEVLKVLYFPLKCSGERVSKMRIQVQFLRKLTQLLKGTTDDERTTSSPPPNFARLKVSGAGTASRPVVASSLHRVPITCFTSTLTEALLRCITTPAHYRHKTKTSIHSGRHLPFFSIAYSSCKTSMV